MHKATKFEGAKVSSDNFSIKNQQIRTNSLRIVWIIRHNVLESLHLFPCVFPQVEALIPLDPIVIFVNDVKFRRDRQVLPLPFPPGSPVSCKAGRSLRPTVKTKAAATFSFPASALPPSLYSYAEKGGIPLVEEKNLC